MKSVPPALQAGAFIGSAGEGRISSATRADYAAAAVAALTRPIGTDTTYELAGDSAYTLKDLAEEANRQTGKTLVYKGLSKADNSAALISAGVPAGFAEILVDSDVGASKDALFDDTHQLKDLIGRPTTSLAAALKAAMA